MDLALSVEVQEGRKKEMAVTPGFLEEQNQTNYMCVQEVHTYIRIKKYQKQCYYRI
jgi:hypothetical protein